MNNLMVVLVIIRCYLQNVFDIVKFIASNYVIIYFRSALGGVFFNSCVNATVFNATVFSPM